MGGFFVGIYIYIIIFFLIFLIPFLIAGIALLVNGLKEFKVLGKNKAKAIVMTSIGAFFITLVMFGCIIALMAYSDAISTANSSSNSCFNCPPSKGPQSSELMGYLIYYLY